MRRAIVAAAALAALTCVLPLSGRAAQDQESDWPCEQRLVPKLSAASLWSSPSLKSVTEDWHAEPAVAALVAKIAPRSVSAAQGVAAIKAFVQPLDQAQRARLAPLAFLGLVAETNRERSELISRLMDFGARQRSLAALISRMSAEHDAIPPDATGDAANRRNDLAQRVAFSTRAFDGMQRTIRYACEAPGELEARLGAYARALRAALK